MPEDIYEDSEDEPEFSVTDLRPPRQRPRAGVWRRLRLGAESRGRRWVAVGISLMLALAVLLSSLPAAQEIFGRLPTAFASPTATPNFQVISSIHVESGAAIEEATPLPGVSGIPPLGAAPRSCPQKAARPQYVGPGYGKAIGGPSVWVTGFTRTYPTLSLRDEGRASNAPYGWPLRYTAYGWPAPIVVVLAHDVKVPVTLSGWDPRNTQPLWFAFDPRGTPPEHVGTSLTLDPNHPELPPNGIDETGTFWFGYIFLPREGCYALAASAPGGGGAWSAMFSAGL
jgi:hypothetical protein